MKDYSERSHPYESTFLLLKLSDQLFITDIKVKEATYEFSISWDTNIQTKNNVIYANFIHHRCWIYIYGHNTQF